MVRRIGKLLWIIAILGLMAAIYISILLDYDVDNTFLGTILGVVTFLFGIFIAFSVSDRHNRLEKIRGNDSMERSQLGMIYHSSLVFGKEFQKKIKKAIDEYLMATFDYKVREYYMTEKQYQNLVNLMCGVEIKTPKQSSFFSYFMAMINNMTMARKSTIGLIDETLSKFEWVIYILLSGLLILALMLVNTGSAVSILIVAVLMITIALLLTFLYSLDNLSWKEETRLFEPYQKTFETLGLERYYPEPVIASGRSTLHKGKVYRMASYPNKYPDISGKTIKLIDDRPKRHSKTQ